MSELLESKLTVCHVISGLGTGGAERMLERLLSFAPKNQVVIALRFAGPQADAIRKLGIPVYTLNLRFFFDLPLKLWVFIRLLRRLKPDSVVGWMYHGNLAASFGGVLFKKPVVWNVRHSLHDLKFEKFGMRAVIRLGSWLSLQPRRIVYNSHVSAEQHKKLGYCAKRSCVLPNGFDVHLYRPDSAARKSVRAELELSEDVFLVGHVARYHPMKNHMGFLEVAACLKEKVPDAHFVMVGSGVTVENTELAEEAKRLGISDLVHLLGERRDLSRLMAAFDVLVSSSLGEGFPNVVGEAMACGVPAVVTDVGDSSFLVGETGFVVPSGDSSAICGALKDLHSAGELVRRGRGELARDRIVEQFSLRKIAEKYYALWSSVVRSHG